MIRLGLIGANISHSKSPGIYRDLLTTSHSYELLDYKEERFLPRLAEFNDFFGLNITSPYKSSFLTQLESYPNRWKAINCLKNLDGKWVGTNTDATALEELIPTYEQRFGITDWVVLGDGAMAFVTGLILNDRGIKYLQFSRRVGDDFSRFDFLQQLDPKRRVCIINCCSRNLVIKGSMSKDWIFWDYNYLHEHHAKSIPREVDTYLDGESLLITQAKHAVKFWGLA